MVLAGTIYPHFKGGLRQVELMRLVARAGNPLLLCDGLGWVWDRWVITGVEETKSVFMADGAPRKIEFVLTLSSYGADNG
jgi:phage protein U